MKLIDAEIARRAKISRSFLSELLNGKKRPSWKTAKRLASVTDTDPVVWLDGSPDEIKVARQQGAQPQ